MKIEQFRMIERRLSIARKPQLVTESKGWRNGNRRKRLYVIFKEWAKEQNSKNEFKREFDPDVFKKQYDFVPGTMRYFYRWANPLLCVVKDNLAFFQLSELKKLNQHVDLKEHMIFAATEETIYVLQKSDNTVHQAILQDDTLVLQEQVGDSFDEWLQDLVGRGDILHGEPEEEESTVSSEE